MKKIILASLILFGSNAIAENKSSPQVVQVKVTEAGFVPSQIKVRAGSPVILQVTLKTKDTCATEIHVKEKKIKQKLELDKEVSIDLGILKKGDIRFACGMNMVSGHIIAE